MVEVQAVQNSHCFELKLDRTFAWLLRDLRGDPGNLPSIHGREQRGVIKLEHSWRRVGEGGGRQTQAIGKLQ